jgi:mono/diheme cytochrome c family protein
MMKTKIIAAALALAPALLFEAGAQEVGNPLRGRAYAAQLCAECHLTEPGPGPSPAKTAPPFTAVAKTKGMTAMALSVWLQTSHPTMPNIMLKPETADDIIAYILSLRREAIRL